MNQGRHNVFIARIDASSLRADYREIIFANLTVRLPVLASTDDEGTTFVSTRAVRQHLRVDFKLSQASEWLAMDEIPAKMIVRRDYL